MGIRGLTTYVEHRSGELFRPYQLSGGHVVIDGCSLASYIFRKSSGSRDIFGGDYDAFAAAVDLFFAELERCQLRPIVLVDGALARDKFRTRFTRLKDRLSVLKELKRSSAAACTNGQAFPLLMRDVLVDVVQLRGVPMARADLEADLEIANVARHLRCPVLSQDSDFYIYGVDYIQLNHLADAPYKDKSSGRSYFPCQIFTPERFHRTIGVDESTIPLLAVLLGNDRVRRSVFRKFYSQMKLVKGRGYRGQRRIETVVRWLSNQTYETAVQKLLDRAKARARHRILQSITKGAEAYKCTQSYLMPYLGLGGDPKCFQADDDVEEMETGEGEEDGEEEEEEEEDEKEKGAAVEENDPEIDEVLNNAMNEARESQGIAIDQWFVDRCRKCFYPSFVLDIVYSGIVFCTPQVEDHTTKHSHYAGVDFLEAIFEILRSGQSKRISYIARNRRSRITKYSLQRRTGLHLPKLRDLEHIGGEAATKVLLEVCRLDGTHLEAILQLPGDWQLYFLAVVCWSQRATDPPASLEQVYALLLCAVVLDVVEANGRRYRCLRTFNTRHGKRIQEIRAGRKKLPAQPAIVDGKQDLQAYIDAVDHDDCWLCMASLVQYFEVEENQHNGRNFSIAVVDVFSKFQGCLLYVRTLNQLLNHPLPQEKLWRLFSGTFLHNITVNFNHRSSLEAYLETLLGEAPTVLRLLRKTADLLLPLLKGVQSVGKGRSRAKKRRQNRKAKQMEKQTEQSSSEEENADQEDQDDYKDMDNKFYALKTV